MPSCTDPAGESPVRVIAGEPGSGPPPEAKRPTDEAGSEPSPLLPVPPAKPRGSKMKKWTCPCGVNVRVAVPLFDATCKRCLGRFLLAA